MKGKLFYQHCLEVLPKGFFILAQMESKEYALFNFVDQDGDIRFSGWEDKIDDALHPLNVMHTYASSESFEYTEDIKVIDYYRPNDIFPSNPHSSLLRLYQRTVGYSEDNQTILTKTRAYLGL